VFDKIGGGAVAVSLGNVFNRLGSALGSSGSVLHRRPFAGSDKPGAGVVHREMAWRQSRLNSRGWPTTWRGASQKTVSFFVKGGRGTRFCGPNAR
jgi:hypothetical protein